MSTKISDFGVFFAQNLFPWPNGQLLLVHIIHILKANVPAANLAYLGTRYVHPVTRQIFCNVLGSNLQYQLKPCPKAVPGRHTHSLGKVVVGEEEQEEGVCDSNSNPKAVDR